MAAGGPRLRRKCISFLMSPKLSFPTHNSGKGQTMDKFITFVVAHINNYYMRPEIFQTKVIKFNQTDSTTYVENTVQTMQTRFECGNGFLHPELRKYVWNWFFSFEIG